MFLFDRRYLAVLGGFLIQLAIGITFTWGALSPYFCDYFRKNQPIEIKQSEFNIIFSFTTFGMFIGQSLSVSVSNKLGSRKAIFLMGSLYSACIFGSSLVKHTLFFGIFWGLLAIFAGTCFISPIMVCQKYFPQNRGIISGIVLSGFGFSSVIKQTIMVQIINPQNLTAIEIDGQLIYDAEVIQRVPYALQVVSCLTFCLIAIGSFLLKNKKPLNQDVQFLVSNISNRTQLLQNIQINDKTDCQSVLEAQKTKAFYLIFFMYFLAELIEYCIQANYKTFGYEKIKDDKFLALVVGNLSCFANGLWRLIYGILYDKFGFKTSFNILVICNIFLILTLSFIDSYKIFYSIWTMIILGGQGGLASLMVSFTVEIFGITQGGNIYARILIAQTFANFFQQFIVLGLKPSIGYLNIFYVFTFCNLIAFLINNYCPPQYKRKFNQQLGVSMANQIDQKLINNSNQGENIVTEFTMTQNQQNTQNIHSEQDIVENNQKNNDEEKKNRSISQQYNEL